MARYETKLSEKDEKLFQVWKQKYAPKDSGFDYDLRGAFKAGFTPDPKTGHWPDTFKKPNHPTFSVESIYAKDRPDLAGRWEGDRYLMPDRKRINAASRIPFGTGGYVVGSQGIGSTAGGYQAPPGLPTTPLPTEVRARNRAAYLARNVSPESTPATEARDAAGGVVAPWNRGDPRYDPAAAAALAQQQQAGAGAGGIDVAGIRGQSAAPRQALAEQRDNAQNLRGQLINHLVTTQYDRHGRPHQVTDPRVAAQIAGIDHELSRINYQERQLDHQDDLNVAAAFRNHASALKDLENQRNKQTADDGAGFVMGLRALEAKDPSRSSPEFQAGFQQLFHDFPNAKYSKQAMAAARPSAKISDTESDRLRKTMETQLHKIGITSQDFVNATNIRGSTADPTATKEEIEAGRGGVKPDQSNAKTIAFNVGDRTFAVDAPTFKNFASVFRPQAAEASPFQQVPADQTQSATATPPIEGTINGLPASEAISNIKARNQAMQTGGDLSQTETVPSRTNLPPTTVQDVTPQTPQPTTAQPQATPPTVRVQHPNGQVGTIPSNQLQDALNQGYSQLQ